MDHSESIAKGVQLWLEANGDTVRAIIREEVAKAMPMIAKAMGVAAATELGRFLDGNRHELLSVIGAAMAASHLARVNEDRTREAGQ
jgi:hypothetical protein